MTTKAQSKSASLGGVFLSLVALVIVMGLATWYLMGHLSDFKKILEVDPLSFALLSIFAIMSIFISGTMINAIVHIFDVRLSLWEGFGLSALNTMANFYLSKAGVAAKAVYLKKRHNFPYMHYVSATAGTYVIALTTQGMLGLVFYLLLLRSSAFHYELLVAFGAIAAAGLLPLLLPALRIRARARFIERAQRMLEGWEQVRRHRPMLLAIALLNMAFVVAGAVRLFISYRALGYEVEFLPCLVMSPLSTLTLILSITPGAVGVRQALIGYSSKLLDIGLTEGVVASTVDHAVGTIWVFVFGLIFSNWIWAHRLGKKTQTPPEGSG